MVRPFLFHQSQGQISRSHVLKNGHVGILMFHKHILLLFQSPEEPKQPQLGAKEMADLEKELELDLENLDVNDAVSRLTSDWHDLQHSYILK